jgi:hypothetical protein
MIFSYTCSSACKMQTLSFEIVQSQVLSILCDASSWHAAEVHYAKQCHHMLP